MGLRFRLHPLRFEFEAQESLFFAPGKAANILRGSLGLIFRKIACVSHCGNARTCSARASCAYAQIFEPRAATAGPGSLADWPRPFVFRARHLDGQTIPPGGSFSFGLNVFSLDPAVLKYFVLTFQSLACEGVGPRRGKAELRRVTSGDQLLYNGLTETSSTAVTPLALDLTPSPASPARIRVDFLTPTELKHENRIVSKPEFPILFGRVRDRIATLSRLYGGELLDIDYRGTNERAAAIRMTSCRLRDQEVRRRSTRTGQSHSIGGFVGTAEYEGNLAEFLPFLRAAKWTGVGRQSVWGKGEFEVDLLPG